MEGMLNDLRQSHETQSAFVNWLTAQPAGGAAGAPAADGADGAAAAAVVSVFYLPLTFRANLAHNLTRSPVLIFLC